MCKKKVDGHTQSTNLKLKSSTHGTNPLTLGPDNTNSTHGANPPAPGPAKTASFKKSTLKRTKEKEEKRDDQEELMNLDLEMFASDTSRQKDGRKTTQLCHFKLGGKGSQ